MTDPTEEEMKWIESGSAQAEYEAQAEAEQFQPLSPRERALQAIINDQDKQLRAEREETEKLRGLLVQTAVSGVAMEILRERVKELEEGLGECKKTLTYEGIGKYEYMEGSQIYKDFRNTVESIDKLLSRKASDG